MRAAVGAPSLGGMWPACAWEDENARVWTVVGRLEDRQSWALASRARARVEVERASSSFQMMTAASMQQDWERRLVAEWSGGPTVLALLFASPDSRSIRSLDSRGGYFDLRTGDTWDLFFPGYYRSARDPDFERQCGARPVGQAHLSDWYFGPREFNDLRQYVESCSEGRWSYSGEADLVLINAWVPDQGPPTIDWASTVSGQLTDQVAGKVSLTLGGVVEAISRDLEREIGSAEYGVGEVVAGGAAGPTSTAGRDIITAVLGEIVAALAVGGLGIR